MKKAQITIFIVLGIVIMIAFGLLFFVSNTTSDSITEQRINKIYSDFLDSTDIRYVTNVCLDKTTKEALWLIGLQGGRIYDTQIEGGYPSGSFYDVIPFYFEGNFYNVSYGIKAPTNLPYPNAPEYPYPDTSLVENPLVFGTGGYSENDYAHLFAFQNESVITAERPLLPALCNYYGPNYWGISGAKFSCETNSRKNESVQEYIKQYIDQKLEGCINITFEEISGYNISTGDISSTVLIGNENIFVSLKYPIKISVKGRTPVTNYLDFTVSPKLRLKLMHEIASHLIGVPKIQPNAESDNIFFNMLTDDPNDCVDGKSSCIDGNITRYKLRDYCLNNRHCMYDNRHYNYSDIFVIEDNKSIVEGKPFRFQFVIENRRPALDWIDESVDSDAYYSWYIKETYGRDLFDVYSKASASRRSNSFNILIKTKVFSARDLELFPLGIDPDEENLTYNYTKVSESHNCPVYPYWDGGTFENSFYYRNGYWRFGIGTRNFVSGFVSDHELAKDSVIYNVPKCRARHELRITVTDSEGLEDYQDVVIRIRPPV